MTQIKSNSGPLKRLHSLSTNVHFFLTPLLSEGDTCEASAGHATSLQNC